MRTFRVWGIKVHDLLPEESYRVFGPRTAAKVYVGHFLQGYELTGHGHEYSASEREGRLVRLWKFESVDYEAQMGAPVWVLEDIGSI